jgi:tRNA (adenine57-N1/adenine58-N1)-methyltransferase
VNGRSNSTRADDLVQLVGQDHKNFILTLRPGAQLQTHRGNLEHDDLIGASWGSKVYSHLGKPFYLLQPSIHDLLLDTRRSTQIMYPKDIGFVLLNMDIGPGKTVLEAGTGSGGLTTALAYAVGSQGKVISYEVRPEKQDLARKNIQRVGFEDRVVFKLGDIREGFDEKDIDAVFLDVPNPEDYILQVRDVIKPGGNFGCILPTVNQIARLLLVLKTNHFALIEVCETLLRYYKTNAQRLRPTDRMVAHTGYLIFGRMIVPDPVETKDWDETGDGYEI